MAVSIAIKRGTRAQLETAAGNGGLVTGEPYLITDEGRIAVGTGPETFVTYAKKNEVPTDAAEDWGFVAASATASFDYGSIV